MNNLKTKTNSCKQPDVVDLYLYGDLNLRNVLRNYYNDEEVNSIIEGCRTRRLHILNANYNKGNISFNRYEWYYPRYKLNISESKSTITIRLSGLSVTLTIVPKT